jgi:hypothetical protein
MQQLEVLHQMFWRNIVGKGFAQANYTDALNILSSVEIIVQNPELKKRIEWLHANTCEDIKQPAAVVELLVFRNISGGTNKELELGGKTYTLSQLFGYGAKLLTECTKIMTELTKNYSFDIKYGTDNQDAAQTNKGFQL